MRLLILISFIFVSHFAHADCSATPAMTSLSAGKAGEIKWSLGTGKITKAMYCDGSNWQELTGSVGGACTKSGEMSMVSGEMSYCRTANWVRFDSTGNTNSTCSKTGEVRWNAPNVEFCNGTNWRVVDPTDSTPDTFEFNTLTSQQWDAATFQAIQIGGFSGGTANFTFDVAACTSASARICDTAGCSTMLSQLSADGSMYVPNQAFLRLAFITPAVPSVNCSISVTLNGITTKLDATTAITDTSVNWFSIFTEQRSVTHAALIESNIAKTTGHSAVSIAISDLGTGGSPQYRTCSDAACSTVVIDWTNTSGTLNTGEYVQLRTTSGNDNFTLRRVQVSAGTGTPVVWNSMTSTCPSNTSQSPGVTVTCTCPAGYLALNGAIRGAGNYMQISNICTAALHAGVYSNATGGTVTLKASSAGIPAGTCPSFLGTTANGVTSVTGTSGASMFFPPAPDVCN